ALSSLRCGYHGRLHSFPTRRSSDLVVVVQGMADFDADGNVLNVSGTVQDITPYRRLEDRLRLAATAIELLNRPSGKHDESFFRRLLGRLRTYGRWKGELWARAKNGRGFAMLLTDVKGMVSCIVAAERLLEVITEPYAVNGISVALGASLGIAVSPQHGDEIRCLL